MSLSLRRFMAMRPRPRRWIGASLHAAVLLAPLGFSGGQAWAGDPVVLWAPRDASAADRTRFDLELTLRARRLLLEDSELTRFDISVHVANRVAAINGAVPSKEVARQAEASLHKLLGLAGIQNQLRVEATFANVADSRMQMPSPLLVVRAPFAEPFVALTPVVKTALSCRPPTEEELPPYAWQSPPSFMDRMAQRNPLLPEGASPTSPVWTRATDVASDGKGSLRIQKAEVAVPRTAPVIPDDVFSLPAINLSRTLRGVGQFLSPRYGFVAHCADAFGAISA